MSSSSSSACAACKFLRRKCTPSCVFAPYFPPDQPAKFASVHRVFGTSNVAKLLNELSPSQREDAANSLAYEAEARLLDPVYGCVGYIWLLQHKIKQLQHDLHNAKEELSAHLSATALGPSVADPHHLHQCRRQLPAGASPSTAPPMITTAMSSGLSKPGALSHRQILRREHQQHMAAVQQVAAAAVAAGDREQAMLRSYEQQQLARFNTVVLLEGDLQFHRQMAGGAAMAATPWPFEGLFSVQQQHTRTQKQQAQQMMRVGQNNRGGGVCPGRQSF